MYYLQAKITIAKLIYHTRAGRESLLRDLRYETKESASLWKQTLRWVYLGRLWSVHRAYGVAGTAVDALFGVDHIGLPLGDAIHRTFGNTSPTGDAFFMNKVSQQSHLPPLVLKHCNTSIREVNTMRAQVYATFS